MKICPVCRTTYDHSQNFCLNDGTPLVDFAANEPQQVQPLDEATVIKPNEPETIVGVPASAYPTFSGTQTALEQPSAAPATVIVERKSNTGKIVVLTALATLLLAALVGGGVYLWWRGRQQVAVVNENTNARARNANAVAANSNLANTNKNANVSNLNVNSSPSPSPSPALAPEQATKIRKDVTETLAGWKESTENRDIENHMSYYAPVVDFYKQQAADPSRIRSERQKAFQNYSDMEVKLSNIKVTPDPSGEKAVVVLDKTWVFTNDEATSEGSVQQQLTLSKIGDRWYITGEKDLKEYYKSKY